MEAHLEALVQLVTGLQGTAGAICLTIFYSFPEPALWRMALNSS